MTFEIDKESVDEIKKRVDEQVGRGISDNTKEILSSVENQMYLAGTSLDKDEFEKSILARFNFPKQEFEDKIKLPIEGFFEVMKTKKIFLNSISEACYLLDQLPPANEITKQHLADLDKKCQAEGRGVNNEQLKNIMTNFEVIVNQEKMIFDKINSLPRTQDERAVALRLEEIVNAYATILELLSQLLYEVLDEVTNYLVLTYPTTARFQTYRGDFERDRFTIEKMIGVLEEVEKQCSVNFLTNLFEGYLRKDIRNMVFHKRYKIERGMIREKDLSKPLGDLINLNQKQIFDEFIKLITTFDCLFLNLYYQHMPQLMKVMDKLRVVSELQKEEHTSKP